MSNDRHPSCDPGAADTMWVVDTGDAQEGVSQHVRDQAIAELSDIFVNYKQQLRVADCPALVALIRSWLLPGSGVDVDDFHLELLIVYVLCRAERADLTRPTGRGADELTTRNAYREGARGFLFLPRTPEDAFAMDPATNERDSGSPKGSDLELVTGDLNPLDPSNMRERQRWGALRHARVKPERWTTSEVLMKKGRFHGESYSTRLIEDFEAFLGEQGAIDEYLRDAWVSSQYTKHEPPTPEHQSALSDDKGEPSVEVTAAHESRTPPTGKTLADSPGQVGGIEASVEGKPARPGRDWRGRPKRDERSEPARLPHPDRKPMSRKVRLFLFGGVPIMAIVAIMATVGALNGFWGLGTTGAGRVIGTAATPHTVNPSSSEQSRGMSWSLSTMARELSHCTKSASEIALGGESAGIFFSQDGSCWSRSMRIDPTMPVEMLVTYKNSSGRQADNVTAFIRTDNAIALIQDTTYFGNSNDPNGAVVVSNKLAGVGINVGSYASGANAWWIARVEVSPPDKCGGEQFTATAHVQSDLGRTRSDEPISPTATVKVPSC